MHALKNAVVLSSALAIVFIAPGCGGATDDFPRHAISGTVTLDGKPLGLAAISFDPDGQANQKPVSVGAPVVGGSYSIARDVGPTPGKYRVSVVENTAGEVDQSAAPGAPPKATKGKPAIPEKYNTKSTLTAEVKADGPNTFNFDLTTK